MPQQNGNCDKVCDKATAPIDIPLTCSETCGSGSRCSYKYDYSITDLKITNKGNYLSITETNAPKSKAACTYNAAEYIVNEMRIYTPSLHSFNGEKTEAEMILVHDPLIGGVAQTAASPLLVCLPIGVGMGGKIPGASILNEILNNASSSTPTKDKVTTIPSSSSHFSLNKFIPQQGFYVYSGTLPYASSDDTSSIDVPSCSYTDVQYIVFNKNINFNIAAAAKKSLKKIVNDSNFCVNSKIKCGESDGGLRFNKYPPKLSNTSDDIYIDCQPVNSSGQTMVEEPSPSSAVWGASLLDSLMNSGIISMFFGFFFMILLYHFSKKFFKSIGVTPDIKGSQADMANEQFAQKIKKRRKQRNKAIEKMDPNYQKGPGLATRAGRGIGRAAGAVANKTTSAAKTAYKNVSSGQTMFSKDQRGVPQD